MKNTGTILMMILAVSLLQACNNDDEKKEDTVEVKAVPGKTVTVTEEDAKFAVKAFEAGVNETELSFFAKDKLTNTKLKDFADMMMRDHGKANTELMAMTAPKNIVLSTTLNMEGQNAKTELEQKEGSEFDKAYAEHMLNDHKKAVEVFEDAAKNVTDAQLKAFAAKTLPTLKAHLQAINTINDGLK